MRVLATESQTFWRDALRNALAHGDRPNITCVKSIEKKNRETREFPRRPVFSAAASVTGRPQTLWRGGRYIRYYIVGGERTVAVAEGKWVRTSGQRPRRRRRFVWCPLPTFASPRRSDRPYSTAAAVCNIRGFPSPPFRSPRVTAYVARAASAGRPAGPWGRDARGAPGVYGRRCQFGRTAGTTFLRARPVPPGRSVFWRRATAPVRCGRTPALTVTRSVDRQSHRRPVELLLKARDNVRAQTHTFTHSHIHTLSHTAYT